MPKKKSSVKFELSDKYSFFRDEYSWTLETHYEGINRQGENQKYSKSTYYAKFPMLCSAILEREAMDCEDIEELKNLFITGVERLAALIKSSLGDIDD